MKPGQAVSERQFLSALRRTVGELERAGFWPERGRLDACGVFWCPLPQITMPSALGFFVHHDSRVDRWLGYRAGNIYIPAWVLLHGPWQERGSLRDVLRHEFGHAVAHYYPALVERSTRFRAVFGGGYWDECGADGDDEEFVSRYARTGPSEDFSETFMLFLRHAGRLPDRCRSAAVRQKWRFVAELARVIRAGRARW